MTNWKTKTAQQLFLNPKMLLLWDEMPFSDNSSFRMSVQEKNLRILARVNSVTYLHCTNILYELGNKAIKFLTIRCESSSIHACFCYSLYM